MKEKFKMFKISLNSKRLFGQRETSSSVRDQPTQTLHRRMGRKSEFEVSLLEVY
jgi:hypothetical protein